METSCQQSQNEIIDQQLFDHIQLSREKYFNKVIFEVVIKELK